MDIHDGRSPEGGDDAEDRGIDQPGDIDVDGQLHGTDEDQAQQGLEQVDDPVQQPEPPGPRADALCFQRA